MKKLFIFRGDNWRIQNVRGECSALKYINNWREYLFKDVVDYDIAFITYETHILQDLVKELNPKYVKIVPNTTQQDNVEHVVKFMETVPEYDRFIILRFDVIYKVKLESWPLWNEKGIFFAEKDIYHWIPSKWCNDLLFIVDRDYIQIFKEAAAWRTPRLQLPHIISQYLWDKGIPFHIMYDHNMHQFFPEHPFFGMEYYLSPDQRARLGITDYIKNLS